MKNILINESQYKRIFESSAKDNVEMFMSMLNDGERIVFDYMYHKAEFYVPFSRSANEMWGDWIIGHNLYEVAKESAHRFTDVVDEAILSMLRERRTNKDLYVPKLSKEEVKKVATVMFTYFLEKKKERMREVPVTKPSDYTENSIQYRRGNWSGKWEKPSNHTVKESTDRHREGYWKERWAKQKSERETNRGGDEPKKDRTEYFREYNKKRPKKDRRAYYRDYNKKHPERLNRGFTKGYYGSIDGNKILGYDVMGRPITDNPFSDTLRNKEMQWHDDDWYENCE